MRAKISHFPAWLALRETNPAAVKLIMSSLQLNENVTNYLMLSNLKIFQSQQLLKIFQ